MDHLSLEHMRDQAAALRQSLAELIAQPAFTTKPRSRQWQFLRAVLERHLDPDQAGPLPAFSPLQAAQYKFEVADRLRRYYLRPGRPVRHLFTLVHRSALGDASDAWDWPDFHGYLLLVRDSAGEPSPAADPAQLRQYLERVVAEACAAEFRAYQGLPAPSGQGLERWFTLDGPARREILATLERRRAAGLTLSAPMNPSTWRLLGAKVRTLDSDEAVVATTEYWYLCWQDPETLERVQTYRETNRQYYVLRPEDGAWKVHQNLRPMPRAVAPHRKARQA